MKLVVLIVMNLFGMVALSQATFSVAPLISTKWGISNYSGQDVFSGGGVGISLHYMSQIQQNPHYHYYVKRVGNTAGIDVGLRLLASLKGGKHLLMFDWKIDGSTTSSGISFIDRTYSDLSIDSTKAFPTYRNGSIPFQASYTYTRYSLQYGTRLIENSPLLNLWVLLDISYARVGAIWGDSRRSYGDSPIELATNAKIIEIRNRDWQLDRNIFKFGIGLKSDFFLTTKKKKNYLFTLEAHYRHGLKVIGLGSYEVLIENSDKKLESYYNEVVTRGSGIYLQVSRSFQLYPWKSKAKSKTKDTPLTEFYD